MRYKPLTIKESRATHSFRDYNAIIGVILVSFLSFPPKFNCFSAWKGNEKVLKGNKTLIKL